MVKAAWGQKRTCTACGVRFYDLSNTPIKCPKCGNEHDIEDFAKSRRRAAVAATAASKAAKPKKEMVDGVVLADGELPEVEDDAEAAAADDDLDEDNADLGAEVDLEEKKSSDDV